MTKDTKLKLDPVTPATPRAKVKWENTYWALGAITIGFVGYVIFGDGTLKGPETVPLILVDLGLIFVAMTRDATTAICSRLERIEQKLRG